ncbi:dethiobiotin synthase [Novispirillum itersonii]|uniref:ATP-dependent dethiobiotin synthetase BioD n=1 Tax=Novispirillum itersonii TaxID=189 RepID=A0A7X0DN14_NOVIT|nr:dethiobiotin synthase [Novispirillum itersonii]MBB6211683.1 dethiobiotin synthase [Novispirillum itersonii]
MRGVFMTGTDTDAGKTIASACLLVALRRRWPQAGYWKPVQSGLDDLPRGDTGTVADLTGSADADFPAPAYTFRAPLSPDQAAAREGAVIDASTLTLPAYAGPLVVEGAGGIMVPVDGTLLMLDLAERLALPVVVAARTGLGTINHTLLTLAALRSRNLRIGGVLFSGPDHPDNIATIARLGGVPVLGRIPRLPDLTAAAIATAADTLDISPLE